MARKSFKDVRSANEADKALGAKIRAYRNMAQISQA